MYAEASLDSKVSRSQLHLMYRNTLYKLERERAVLLCMVKQYVQKGVKNLGEEHKLIQQNRKVDDIIVQEMKYRKLLGILEQ